MTFDHSFMMRHHTENMTIRALAKEAGVHPNQLRRAMIRAGVEIKSKSNSMKDAFKAGNLKAKSGFSLSESHKDAISKANKGKIVGLRNTTNNFIIKQKSAAQGKSAMKNREAAKKGSKFERILIDKLKGLSYAVNGQHKLGDYKIDLFLPAYNLAIEIDGPAHREAIYGPDKLESSKAKDKAKDQAMKQMGMTIIRIIDNQKGISKYNTKVVMDFILETIKMLETNSHLYRVVEIH